MRCSGLGARGDVLVCVGNSRCGNCNCFGGGFGCVGGKFDLGNASSGGDFNQTSAGGGFTTSSGGNWGGSGFGFGLGMAFGGGRGKSVDEEVKDPDGKPGSCSGGVGRSGGGQCGWFGSNVFGTVGSGIVIAMVAIAFNRS